MDLADYRKRLDEIDGQLLDLFSDRMTTVGSIAAYKKEKSLPVFDEKREKEKLLAISENCPSVYSEYAIRLFSVILELSRAWQDRILREENDRCPTDQESVYAGMKTSPDAETR